MKIDEIKIDWPGHEVTVKGAPVNLSSKEFELLKILVNHPGQVLTREQLLNLVWGNDFYGDDRTVDVHIRWLREKLENNPSEPRYILTIRGTGYTPDRHLPIHVRQYLQRDRGDFHSECE